MPTVQVNNLISRAATVVQDTTKVRWQNAEWLDWLNDGQREVAVIRPTACTENEPFTMVTGTRQTLPEAGVMFIDVTRNLSPGTDAVRICSREVLDAQRPGWHGETNTQNKVVHYVYDPRNPKNFYVYTQATAGWTIELVYSKSPDAAALDGYITLDDIYANALVDYMLYRAYSKDAEYAGNGQRAMNAYSAFQNSLGVKTQNEMTSNPNLTTGGFNPNLSGGARV